MIDHLCVIGVGLIGGSFARALREQGGCQRISGVGRDLDNLKKAVELGVIDHFYFDAREAAKEADVVFLAAPVGSYESLLGELKDVWKPETIYTDAGSTKQSVIASLKSIFGEIPPNFVPGHPVAGAENSGVLASRSDLFKDRQVILTPDELTSQPAVDKMVELWEISGASVSLMSAAHHDKVLAETSHLPHMLAFALVDLLGKKDEKREVFKYAAGGFKDFTRIASSDPRMWVDICMANKDEIIPLLSQFAEELKVVSDLLEGGREGDLLAMFKRSNLARERFLGQSDKN